MNPACRRAEVLGKLGPKITENRGKIMEDASRPETIKDL